LLFTGSIKDNIRWGKEQATLKEIRQAARDAQIHDTIMELPDGYDTRVGQKGVNLSGGQKQRISIARALIRQPKILMLDDSTISLDIVKECSLLYANKQYIRTILIITQNIFTALHAARILLIDDGKMLTIITHSVLLEISAIYEHIVESQFGKE